VSNFELLTDDEKQRAWCREILKEEGEEIHVIFDLCDDPILLWKKCNHKEGVWIHEFRVYHSKSGKLVFLHRCDNCMLAINISESYYRKAEEIYKAGGDYID
jgi:hypothetical protein